MVRARIVIPAIDPIIGGNLLTDTHLGSRIRPGRNAAATAGMAARIAAVLAAMAIRAWMFGSEAGRCPGWFIDALQTSQSDKLWFFALHSIFHTASHKNQFVDGSQSKNNGRSPEKLALLTSYKQIGSVFRPIRDSYSRTCFSAKPVL
jgi:hypothetical protein